MAKRKQPLRGATKARLHSPLLKGKTRADESSKMADDLGVPLLPWQRWLLDDMMRVDAKGMYVRKTTLLIQARQNGKSHLGRMRVIWGLFYGGEQKHLIMSSNRATALMTFREIAWIIENAPQFKAATKAIRYANGGERIELLNGATLDLVSDTRDSSRGRTCDFLWIDEVREISKDGYTAAIPTTRARANSQTLLTSNAGDAFSETLNTLRERALSAPPKSFGFYEWSAPQYCKITDRAGWAMANPALGYTITEESLEEAVATNKIEDTRTELLCQWIDSLQSPWPHGVLEATSDATLTIPIGGYTVFGFDVSPSRRNASLVAGQIMGDGRIGVGILQTWESSSLGR
jgi:phage terminase large subunit-like protein